MRDKNGKFKKGHKKLSNAGNVVGGWNKGIKHSDEHKKKISKALGGKKNPFYGKKHSKESIKKMKANHTDKPTILTDKERREHSRFWSQRYKVQKKQAAGSHTLQEWLLLKAFYKNMCLCCKQFEPEIKLTEDHIVPLSMGGTDNIDNIQPLCESCNSRKFTKTIDYRETLKGGEINYA